MCSIGAEAGYLTRKEMEKEDFPVKMGDLKVVKEGSPGVKIIRDEDKLKNPESYREYKKRMEKLEHRAEKWPMVGHILFIFGAVLFSINLGEGLPMFNLLLGVGMMVLGLILEHKGMEGR